MNSLGFEVTGRIAVRSALSPIDRYPDGVGTDDPASDVDALWADPDLRGAVEVASASLAAVCAAIVAGRERDEHKVRRALKSLVAYRLRYCTRATPFGLFAGMAMVELGDTRQPVLTTGRHRAHLRPSSASQRDRVATAVRAEDTTMLWANPSLSRRGDRLVVRLPRSVAMGRSVAVRATAPARSAIAHATKPQQRRALQDHLTGAFPQTDAATIHTFIDNLIDNEILIPAAGHSLFAEADQVTDATAVPIADAAGRVRACRAQIAPDREVRNPMLCDVELAVDGEVPTRYVDHAADVLDVLLRTSLVPSRFAAIADHTARFGERFGQTLVPLAVATDLDDGVGFPDDERSPAASHSDTAERARIDLRTRLVERSRRMRSASVELVDSDVADLPIAGEVATSYDMFLQLENRGGETVSILSPVSTNFPGGRAVGRFTSVMPAARAHARAVAATERRVYARQGDPPLLAEVDHVHGRDALNDVAAGSVTYPVVLQSNAHTASAPDVIGLDDIHLGLEGGAVRLFLADGTPIGFRQVSMVAPESSPELLRLLHDLTWEGAARPYFSWGALEETTAHLPEVTCRGVVLSRQRWRFVGSDTDVTPDAVARWCLEAGLTRYVYCGEFDNKLLVDTTNPLHRALLCDAIAAGSDWVFAAPVPADLGVLADDTGGGHVAEVVVTLATDSPTLVYGRSHHPLYDASVALGRIVAPGGTWLYLAFAVDIDDQNAVLSAVADVLDDAPWYFVRYSDEKGRDQLRLRAELSIADAGGVLEVLGGFRSAGTIGDVTIPTHQLEVERYGGIDSLGLYLRSFCAETRSMLPVLDLVPPTRTDESLRPDIGLCAHLVTRWLSAVDEATGQAAAIVELGFTGYEQELGSRVHRLRKAIRSVDIASPGAAADAMGDGLDRFWRAHGNDPHLASDPHTLQSALHMFCNRIGLARHEEYATLLLWRNDIRRRTRKAMISQ